MTVRAYSSLPLGPFFRPEAEALATTLDDIVAKLRAQATPDAADLARQLGQQHHLYEHFVPTKDDSSATIQTRDLVLIREALAYACPLADALFAVQGLGMYPLVLAGSAPQQRRYLHKAMNGEAIAAFALTEPEAGSDVASMACRATKDGAGWRLDGEKMLISNVPIADYYIVFANADPVAGRNGITAFIVPADAAGLQQEAQPLSIDHPIGRLSFAGCRLSDDQRLGAVGDGFGLAMQTLDTFRISVGAAANGMASAALEDAIEHVKGREQFGKALAKQQLVQGYVADMATELDAGRLLVARAAYVKDTQEGRASTEAAMAKMYATEAAQRIIDLALQLHGGRGVLLGTRVEALYRDIRPLRIYEGTTEIQKLIISRGLLRG